MKTFFILVILLFGCSSKKMNYTVNGSMVAHLRVLNQSAAIVADVDESIVIKAIVSHVRSAEDQISVEVVSIKDGVVGIYQPDHAGLIEFDTASLSVGWHALFVRLKHDDNIIQEHRLTVFVQESQPSQNSLLKEYQASYDFEANQGQSHLLSNNRLSGCDVHTRSKNIWFCPDYAPAD